MDRYIHTERLERQTGRDPYFSQVRFCAISIYRFQALGSIFLDEKFKIITIFIYPLKIHKPAINEYNRAVIKPRE